MLLEHGAETDLEKPNKAYLTPIEYTQKNSREREYLLSIRPSLKQYVEDGTEKKE